MRMRVVKRDFYESEAIGALSHWARELLIALWSYLDDNGVGKDDLVGIAAACFRYDLARDTEGTIELISTGMDELWIAGWIARYAIDGTRYIEAADFDFWQKPKNPSKPRYPRSGDPRAEIFQPPEACPTAWLQSSVSVSGSVSGKEDRWRLYGDSTETLRRTE